MMFGMTKATSKSSGSVISLRGRLLVGLAALTLTVPAVNAQGVDSSAARLRWSENLLKQTSTWFASAEARAIADSVIQYQSPQGGWPKSTDVSVQPKSPDDIPPPGRGRANSLDNGAFDLPVRFLARMAAATNDARYRRAVERSLDYLFEAQYPNGGFPQFYPLREGYYSHITYNDGAMIEALTILRDTAEGREPFRFVDEARRRQAAAALKKGIECILRTQIRQNGQLTAWCAQHDAKTLEPAWARAYEPPSLSGGESVGIVRFLMEINEPSPEIIAAVEGAVKWFQTVAMKGWRIDRIRGADGRTERRLVADPAAPLLWARFYELDTNRPLYLDRDSIFRYDYNEVGYERRSGYSYHGTGAASLLEKDYPAWRARHRPSQP
jgi:PelA/Pel-15E family pectate lyase